MDGLGIGFGTFVLFVFESSFPTMVFFELFAGWWSSFCGGGGAIVPAGEMSNL